MEKKKKRIKNKRLAGIVSGLVLLLCVVLCFGIVRTKIIPLKYTALIFAVGVLFDALIFWLIRKRYRALGILLAVLEAAALLFAFFAVNRTAKTLEQITTVSVRKSEVCVYVRQENPAQSIQDAVDYTFGLVPTIEPEDVQTAVSQINSACGASIQTAEFESLSLLADALLNGQIEAVILPSAYLDLYQDMEGYQELPDSLRLLEMQVVEVKVTPSPSPKPTEKPTQLQRKQDYPDFFTVYISGIDNRGALIAKSRSDVNILAAVNTKTRHVLLISIPRDFYVPLSNCGQLDKLTHAGVYGVEVSMDTVGDIFDLDMDYYFRVNFGGFKDIINALGGVTVNSDYSFSSSFGAYYFREGENFLNGEEALAFARERYAFSVGDRQRGRNQMSVIQGVVQKVTSADMLLNFDSVLSAMEGSFETSVPYEYITALVRDQLADGREWTIERESVTGSDANDYCYSLGMRAYVMRPDVNSVANACQRLEELKKEAD